MRAAVASWLLPLAGVILMLTGQSAARWGMLSSVLISLGLLLPFVGLWLATVCLAGPRRLESAAGRSHALVGLGLSLTFMVLLPMQLWSRPPGWYLFMHDWF